MIESVSLFVFGVLAGSLLNLGIYQLAQTGRPISPWSRPDPQAPPRRWFDRIPIVGWLGLRREIFIHGTTFWIRPMMLELSTGLLLVFLYQEEISTQGLVAGQIAQLGLSSSTIIFPTLILYQNFLSHSLLIALMIVASFIDVDEKLIPDSVTVTGTILGLILAASLPYSLLPVVEASLIPAPSATVLLLRDGLPAETVNGNVLHTGFLTFVTPSFWPASLNGAPQIQSLLVGLGCYWFFCFAILPRSWYGRHGLQRASQLFIARFLRGLRTPAMILIIVLGTLGVFAIWWRAEVAWAGLLTALVGMVGSGTLIWAVRIAGSTALGKEAMGFGDVTLMMMIGTFLGWQPCLIIFFLAPFGALVIGVIQWIFSRNQVIPYGPFLCLATLVTIFQWAFFWDQTEPVFWAFGMWLPAILLACVVLMALMLWGWRFVVEHFPTRWSGQDSSR